MFTLPGSTGHISSVPVRMTSHQQATHQLTEFPSESYVQSYAMTDNESEDELEVAVSHHKDNALNDEPDLDVPTNLLPHSNDIELRRKPYEEVQKEKSPRKSRCVWLIL